MPIDAKAAPSKRKLTAADVAKIPRVVLLDEKHRLWGFFTPEDVAMLKVRTPAEWYALACRLLAEQPSPHGRCVVIPYEENAGRVRGRFVLTPWSSSEYPQPAPISPDEMALIEERLNDESAKYVSYDEFRESVIQTLQQGDPENE